MDGCRSVAVIFIIFAVLYSCAKCDRLDQDEEQDVTVWTGEDVDLHCGDNELGSVNRYWKKGEVLLAVNDQVLTNTDQIKAVNRSIIMKISNVSLDNEGQYTCYVHSKSIYKRIFNLRVNEFTCGQPEEPANGSFKREGSSSDDDQYKVGDRIRYLCHRGYGLVGSAIRTCSGPPHGWTPEEPLCEPDYIIRVWRSLETIGDKIAKIEKKIATIENNMSAVDSKVTIIEARSILVESNITSLWSNYPKRDSTRQITDFTDHHHSTNYRHSTNDHHSGNDHHFTHSHPSTTDQHSTNPDEHFPTHDRDFRLFSDRGIFEFKWVVEDINSKVPTKRNHKATFYSAPFYHKVLRYKFKLRLVLHHDKSYDVDLMLLPSENDQQLSWPYSTKFDLILVENNGHETLLKAFFGFHTSCTTDRPLVETVFKCYTFPHDTYDGDDHMRLVLRDDKVIIKIYFFS